METISVYTEMTVTTVTTVVIVVTNNTILMVITTMTDTMDTCRITISLSHVLYQNTIYIISIGYIDLQESKSYTNVNHS